MLLLTLIASVDNLTAQEKIPDLSGAKSCENLTNEEFAEIFTLQPQTPHCYQPINAFERYRGKETRIRQFYQRADSVQWVQLDDRIVTADDFYFFIHASGLYAAHLDDGECNTLALLRVEGRRMTEDVILCDAPDY